MVTPLPSPTASEFSLTSPSASPPFKTRRRRNSVENGKSIGQPISMPSAFALSTQPPQATRSSNFFDNSPKPIAASSYNYGQLTLASIPTSTGSTLSIPPYAPYVKSPKPSTTFFFIVKNTKRSAFPYGTAFTPNLSTKPPSFPPRHTAQPSWATSTTQDASPNTPAESRHIHSSRFLSLPFFFFHLLPLFLPF